MMVTRVQRRSLTHTCTVSGRAMMVTRLQRRSLTHTCTVSGRAMMVARLQRLSLVRAWVQKGWSLTPSPTIRAMVYKYLTDASEATYAAAQLLHNGTAPSTKLLEIIMRLPTLHPKLPVKLGQ
eukprot:364091-Chlamydomonas_euryale.AAC.6